MPTSHLFGVSSGPFLHLARSDGIAACPWLAGVEQPLLTASGLSESWGGVLAPPVHMAGGTLVLVFNSEVLSAVSRASPRRSLPVGLPSTWTSPVVEAGEGTSPAAAGRGFFS